MNWLKRSIFVVLCSAPFIFVSLLWLKYPTWIVHEWMFGKLLVGKIFAPSLGEFGDVYGALNTLFSGLAFSGVIISIVIQSLELKATREELKDTRKEMSAQSEQFKQQTEAVKKQVFEGSFFNMINLHHANVKNIQNSTLFNFYKLSDKLMYMAYVNASNGNDMGREACEKNVRLICDMFMAEHYPVLGHFLRYTHQILKFIAYADLTYKEEVFYSNIFRSQLSSHELLFIYIVGIASQNSDDFKALIERYGLLQYISEIDLNTLLEKLNTNTVLMADDKGDEFIPIMRYKLSDLKSIYADSAYGIN